MKCEQVGKNKKLKGINFLIGDKEFREMEKVIFVK